MNYRLAYRNTGYVNRCEALNTVLANDEVKNRVHAVSRFEGGKGAAREMIEEVLKKKGLWEEIVNGFCCK